MFTSAVGPTSTSVDCFFGIGLQRSDIRYMTPPLKAATPAHLPLLILLFVALKGSGRCQPDAVHLTFVFGVCCVVFLYSFFIPRITEANTDAVRPAVGNALSLKTANASVKPGDTAAM